MSRARLERRTLLLGLVAGPLLARPVRAAPPIVPALADALREVGLAAGGVVWSPEITLTAPETADDGAAVPVTVRLAEGGRPTVVHVFAPGNRKVWLASFTPLSDLVRSEWRLRIRVGKSQTLAAVAKLEDGRTIGATAEVKVTAGGGCRS